MTKIVAWALGDIGSKLYANDPDKLYELASILGSMIEQHHEDDTKGWLLSGIYKLTQNQALM